MKILTDKFYKFLFGFITIILVSLITILVVGAIENNNQSKEITKECSDGGFDC